MLRSYVDETQLETDLARPMAAARQIATTLRSIRGVLHESLASCRQYELLRSSGIPHDKAVREALGIGPIRSPSPREAKKPLYFAGKA
jgi:hypothetical protein